MSRVSELAAEEAERAEAEGEDEAEPGSEPEPVEPEPEPEPEPVDMAKAVKQLDAENERHAKRVADIMGADAAQLYPCPTCSLGPVGFVFALPDAEPEYKQAPDAELCADCNGLGDVLTGAVVERGRFKECPSCLGKGWRNKLAPVPEVPHLPQPAPIDPNLVAQLRAAGYAVIDPPAMPAPVAAM